MYNNRGPADVRRVFTGKDALLLNERGVTLATVDTFTAQVNVTNATYQPLGDTQSHEHLSSYSVNLNITQCIIEDDEFIQDMFTMFSVGQPVMWTFQGVLKGRNGSEQRMIFRDCVPSSQIQWSLFCNCPPELQNLLSYASNVRD